jgi:pilus assembly protein CpaE
MQPIERQVRVMLAGDRPERLAEFQAALAKQGLPVGTGLTVGLDLAADRASRTNPDMVILLIGHDQEAASLAVRQVRSSSSAYIMAAGPATNAQLILRCLHEGADEYVDGDNFDQELPGGLARFGAKRKLSGASEAPGKVISVIGASGGAGASTVAANIAGLLSRGAASRGSRSCGLIDLRLEHGDLAAILSLAPQHTVIDFCANAGRIDRSVLDQMFISHASGLELLAAPWDAKQASLVTPQGLRLLLAMARAKFPYAVMDLDNRLGELAIEALWQSDQILVVTRLDFVSVRNARRLLDRLLEIGLEPERIDVVANRYKQPRELHSAQAEAALGRRISHYVVDDAARVHDSANAGRLVALCGGWARIGRDLKNLAAALNGKPA